MNGPTWEPLASAGCALCPWAHSPKPSIHPGAKSRNPNLQGTPPTHLPATVATFPVLVYQSVCSAPFLFVLLRDMAAS